VNKASFCNCLVMMRPSTMKEDLLSMYNVKVYLQKQFVACIQETKEEIKVSLNVYATRLVHQNSPFRAFLDKHP
jgi:hypothetical protein